VVAAEDEDAARKTHPEGKNSEGVERVFWNGDGWYQRHPRGFLVAERDVWGVPESLSVECIGETELEAGLILASFNAA